MPKGAKFITVSFGHLSEPGNLKPFVMEQASEDHYLSNPTVLKLFEVALGDTDYDLVKRYFIKINGEQIEDDADNIDLKDGDVVLHAAIPDYDVVSADNLDELVRKVNSMYPRFVANGGICWDGKQYHQGMALAGE